MTRIAIVTSIDKRSAVARATIQMAEALAERAEVTIFAEPTVHPLRSPLPLRTIDDSKIRAHDHVIAALGDSPFHIGTFWTARRIPSVVIMHDVLLAHLVAASISLPELRSELVRWYGPRIAAQAMHGAGTPRPFWDTPRALEVPLFEPAIGSATGIVVHSHFADAHIAPRTIAPVRVIPLAYEAPWATATTIRNSGVVRSGSTLLTLGHANVNKCHELVIESLAELHDRSVRFVIAGSISDSRRARLSALAAALGVADQVEILGPVDGAQASHLLDSATLCVNLRMPAIEGGSASLVEQMAAGKCVAVFDHGCYSDAPDNAVVKLEVTADPQSVAIVLRELLADADRRLQIGDRAAEWARQTHSFTAYASQLLDFLGEIESVEPRNKLARQVAAVTRSWGMPHGSPLAHRWASTMTTMTSIPPAVESAAAGD